MFDLFRSRDKAVRILLGAILVIVAFSMVTYLIPGTGGGSTGGQDNVIATVGDEKVTTLEAQKAIQAVLRGGQMPAQYLSIYVPQIVQQLISERALAYEAKRQGIRISDEDVNVAIQNQLPAGFFADGKLVKKAELEAALAQQGMTVADLKQDISRQLLVLRLRNIALEGTLVSPKEVEAEYRKRNETARLQYVLISPAKFESEVKIDDAQMRQFYEKNKAQFQTSAKKSISYVVFDPAVVEASIPITDEDLRKAYSANLDKFRVPERAKARHILLMTKTGDDAVRIKAEGLLKQVKSGGDFAAIAKANSQDPGSAQKGGDLGWVMHGQMVKPFEDVVFSLKPNEISGLVKTEYGYHIVQVMEKEPAHLRTFDEAKLEISAGYRKQRVNDVMQKAAEKAAAAMRKDPSHPEKAAAEAGQPLLHADNVAPGEPLPNIGVSKEVDQAVQGLNKFEVSQPIVAGTKIVVVEVTSMVAAHASTFEEAQPEARKALISQAMEVLLTRKASDLLAKTKELGGDLDKAAKSMGLEVKNSTDFDRQSAVEGVGSASLLPDAFTKPVGTVFGPITAQGNRVIAKVTAQTAPDMSKFAANSASIRDEIKSKRARERNTIFEDGVRQRLTKEGKIKTNQDAITRVIQSYRT